MSRTNVTTADTQIAMAGMPERSGPTKALSCCNVSAGQEVTYFGKIMGGPRFGALGVVKKTLQQRAVVDMGKSGTWNIPYYFLSVAKAA